MRYDENVKILPEGFQREQLLKRDTVIVVTANSTIMPFFDNDAEIVRQFFINNSNDLFSTTRKEMQEIMAEEELKEDNRIRMTL